jgi:hypothetical protein
VVGDAPVLLTSGAELSVRRRGARQDVKLSPDGAVFHVPDMPADGVDLIDGDWAEATASGLLHLPSPSAPPSGPSIFLMSTLRM